MKFFNGMGKLSEVLKKRILLLDGAFGTMIQKKGFAEVDFRGREFMKHPIALAGFNDILNLTKPTSIREIHTSYLEAGADIITTNTFNANAISMSDYGLEKIEGLIYRINKEAVRIAKASVADFEKNHKGEIHFVGGSIGPTNRSASMSPDITDPLKRNITFDKLEEAYREQIEGLIDGGVDLLICETFFDTLNLKAALNAAEMVMRKRNIGVPILVSATVSDNTGRILSGQTIEAFVASIAHFDCVEVVGLNCGFGPDRMIELMETLKKVNPHFSSCHPNAGLPDENGCYNIDAETFGRQIEILLQKGCLNIIGGCCGTTPEYISYLSRLIKEYHPVSPCKDNGILKLSGLDVLEVTDKFLKIGERCNVAGSSKFLKLIKEDKLEEAAEVAKAQIAKGAAVIDINMDDALIEGRKEMVNFLRYILAEPEIAKVPFMIDSSKWDVIESALKEIQGKGIVNSLSLKEGEEIFIRRARKVRQLGFALVVMAFDEKGQADSFERKIEISRGAYDILTKECGFRPEDIIFDVNIMTIGTGMREHSRYAIDYIKAVEWIKKNLPGCLTSGGVSNLSFAFRGKNKIREYMHVIFLHHAYRAGLDMAIINPSQNTSYYDIPENIRNIIEDLIFDRDPEAVEKLIEIAEGQQNEQKAVKITSKEEKDSTIEEILKEDLRQGSLKDLEAHISRALQEIGDPVKIIEGPLLEGMKIVGELFGEGKMFLPQVVKTARTMKKAVDLLSPHMEMSKTIGGKKAGKILIATVKGDVHDIGKNIVSTVLACNNYEIIDLGIMVPSETIVETALKESPDIICLSGLITPSLGEMVETVKQLEKAGIKVPVMVGGAATSLLHTALKINPEYSGTVLHMADASQNPIAAGKLANPFTRDTYLNEISDKYLELINRAGDNDRLLPYKNILGTLKKIVETYIEKPKVAIGEEIILKLPFNEIRKLINWKMFFLAWKLQGKYISDFPYGATDDEFENWIEGISEDREKALEALKLYQNAQKILDDVEISSIFDGKGIVRFEKASSDGANIYIGGKCFPMLRQQKESTEFLSCSDFINKEEDYIGLFAITAGRRLDNLSKEYQSAGDTYNSLLIRTLSDRLVEAGAEWMQRYVSEKIRNIKIRPAWGYPMLPDQTMILETQEFIPYDKIEISLTENGAMYPPASISGLYIGNPQAKYFMVGDLGEDQIKDYAERRGISVDNIKKALKL